jgi:hypothetical protein
MERSLLPAVTKVAIATGFNLNMWMGVVVTWCLEKGAVGATTAPDCTLCTQVCWCQKTALLACKDTQLTHSETAAAFHQQ